MDNKALMTVRQNRYSVPVALAGRRVAARIGAREIVGRSTMGVRSRATDRLSERFGVSAQLDHYLELLARKPGALAALAWRWHQERERGQWPGCFDELWARIGERYRRRRRPPGRWSTC